MLRRRFNLSWQKDIGRYSIWRRNVAARTCI